MKKRLYAIRDNKASFWSPQEDMNNSTAIRNFAYLLNNNQIVGFAPTDYDLYFVGEFDSDTGALIPANPIEFVEHGASLVGK